MKEYIVIYLTKDKGIAESIWNNGNESGFGKKWNFIWKLQWLCNAYSILKQWKDSSDNRKDEQ